MARKYSKKVPQKWITFPEDKDIQLLVIPFSFTYLTIVPNQETINMSNTLDMFISCVKDWKGVIGEDDKPMPCNNDTKDSIAKQDNELLLWVTEECKNYAEKKSIVKEKEVKN